MVEKLTFHFEGRLADRHRMNFYEASRFQYAAARLIVKLSQFRKTGRFVKNITDISNFDVQLVSQTDGSFNMIVEDAGQKKDEEAFIRIPIANLIAFVSERLVEKIDEAASKNLRVKAKSSLAISDGESFDEITEFDQLVNAVVGGKELMAGLPSEVKDLVRRRVSEIHRDRRLEESKLAISSIDVARGQKLIAMAAPLISEMATGLRRSADTLQVTSVANQQVQSVLFLDQKIAKEIETALVDEEITPILGDITQFNKDNGWGKIRIANDLRVVSFSIPADLLSSMRSKLIEAMTKTLIYLQTYCVRDRSGEIVRLIAVGVLATPEP